VEVSVLIISSAEDLCLVRVAPLVDSANSILVKQAPVSETPEDQPRRIGPKKKVSFNEHQAREGAIRVKETSQSLSVFERQSLYPDLAEV